MINGQIIIFILASVLVIAGAYYSTYFLASKTGKMRPGRSGRMIKLLERFSLSKDKSICLIEVKDKVYLIAMTSQNATLLEKMDIKEFETASVSQNVKPTSSQYEPKGAIQKGLWSAYSAFKNGRQAKDSRGKSSAAGQNKTGQSRQTSGEVDNLDLVYKKLQSRLSGTDTADQEYDGENYL